MSNLLEKLIHTQLYSFLESNKVIYNRQFGFRNNHSATHALIDLTEKITSALDREFLLVAYILIYKKLSIRLITAC